MTVISRFYSLRDLQHLEETVNRELREINAQLCANKVSLTTDKTHIGEFILIKKIRLFYEN